MLINRKHVKDAALAIAQNHPRHTGRIERVGASFLERIESRLRELIRDEVATHPTTGKTLK